MKGMVAALTLLPHLAGAATLSVGPGRTYALPSQAIAAAHDGDTVAIQPGRYADCALIGQNTLTIEGVGAGVVLAGKSCDGKGILVALGDTLTVKNLTLRGSRVPNQNGSGIRSGRSSLVVENVRFENDQDGILTGINPAATVLVSDSLFVGNGYCKADCAHALYVGRFARLEVTRSRFLGTKQGHAIKSRAASTVITDSTIADGPSGTSSYAIDIPNGGDVLVARDRIEKGPASENKRDAIMIGEESVTNATRHLRFRDNLFVNDTGQPSNFVRNLTQVAAELSGNLFRGGPVTALAK